MRLNDKTKQDLVLDSNLGSNWFLEGFLFCLFVLKKPSLCVKSSPY